MDIVTVPQLAQALQEPCRRNLALVLQILGPARCLTVLVETLHGAANGGMRTHDGTRHRTRGGIFFHLAKTHATAADRARLGAARRRQRRAARRPALSQTTG